MESRRTTFNPRYLMILVLVAVVSYLWGALTVHKQVFPFPQLLLLKYEYFIAHRHARRRFKQMAEDLTLS